jgi:signal transduction histidine kinase
VAAAAAAAIVLAVLVLGASTYVLLIRELQSSLDRTLVQRAREVARLSAAAPALLQQPGRLDTSASGDAVLVQVVEADGRIHARSTALGGRVLDADPAVREAVRVAIDDARAAFLDSGLGGVGDSLRVYVAPLALVGGDAAGGAVIVGADTGEVENLLGRTRRLAAAAAVAAALLAALAATLLTRRALLPLERLSAGAAEIERTGDASLRLPPPGSRDELGRLSETLNRMLGSLETARQNERRFVADASHELRTPLTALRGNAAYIARHGADAAVLQDIEADAARLARMLDDLLALAREDAAAEPSDSVRLDEVVRDVVRREPRVDLDTPEPVTVRGDGPALERAVTNLVGNALRHGPPDGRVHVRVAAAEGRAQVTVRDEGPGLDDHAARHAFERFWRGPDSGDRPGTGLGLAIVRATAERHGGTASVAGSTFTIDLPLLTELST